MKNSPHHNKHLKHQAIKEANRMEMSSEQGVQNPNFKNQFKAKEDPLPHKDSHHGKKHSRRSSNKDMPEGTESSRVHDVTEKRIDNSQAKTNYASQEIQHKMNKHSH